MKGGRHTYFATTGSLPKDILAGSILLIVTAPLLLAAVIVDVASSRADRRERDR